MTVWTALRIAMVPAALIPALPALAAPAVPGHRQAATPKPPGKQPEVPTEPSAAEMWSSAIDAARQAAEGVDFGLDLRSLHRLLAEATRIGPQPTARRQVAATRGERGPADTSKRHRPRPREEVRAGDANRPPVADPPEFEKILDAGTPEEGVPAPAGESPPALDSGNAPVAPADAAAGGRGVEASNVESGAVPRVRCADLAVACARCRAMEETR